MHNIFKLSFKFPRKGGERGGAGGGSTVASAEASSRFLDNFHPSLTYNSRMFGARERGTSMAFFYLP